MILYEQCISGNCMTFLIENDKQSIRYCIVGRGQMLLYCGQRAFKKFHLKLEPSKINRN